MEKNQETGKGKMDAVNRDIKAEYTHHFPKGNTLQSYDYYYNEY